MFEVTPSSTPKSEKKQDWVTSSEKIEVSVFHSYVATNPLASVAEEEEKPVKEDLGMWWIAYIIFIYNLSLSA